MIGSRVVAEAVRRGHDVTAVSRAGTTPATEHVTPVAADATAPGVAGEIAATHDAIVYAAGPSRTSEAERASFVDGLAAFAPAAAASYLIVIGGAGSLLVGPDTRLVDLPEFPEAYKPEALVHAQALQTLRSLAEQGALGRWSYLSPAPEIGPGERTGSYRSGLDNPIGDTISAEDLSVAVLDEIESPAHVGRRFTVAT